MLENERAALVAMTLQTARLIAERSAHAVGSEARMRVVAIYAGHRAFRQTMLVRSRKGTPLRQLAVGAGSVGFRFLVDNHLSPSRPLSPVPGPSPSSLHF